jgi:hypothetical protein
MAEEHPHEAQSPGSAGLSAETGEPEEPSKGRAAIPAADAARKAVAEVAAFTRRDPESVISIEWADGHWRVGVEMVESHRIPDSADILAVYEVELLPSGALHSYRRVRRYSRGQLSEERRGGYR